MVRKMYLLPNMVVFGIYVRFQGGIAFSLPNTFVRIVFFGTLQIPPWKNM